MAISRQEVLMQREVEYPLTPELEKNLQKLLVSLNKFRQIYGKPMVVTSGYRPGHYNKAANGAVRSSHLTCEACDFRDTDGSLAQWCLNNVKILEDCELYMESPTRTKGWVHLQIRPTSTRVFMP